MNPLRALFLTLSRMPPALMLVLIVGLAVLITLTITSGADNSKLALERERQLLIDKANAKTKAVYVIRDIPEGGIIQADALSEKDLELGRLPQDAVTSSTIAIGRRAKFGVNAGQILSSHDLAPMGISLDFNSRLPEGMRAVTFAVDSNSGVAGFVTPESHVDVISMVGAGADTRVSAILSDVPVVAVGQQYEKEARSGGAIPPSSVTVAVSPEDTQKLIKAVAASKLYLSLRNDRDHTPIATVDVTSLFASPKKPAGGEPSYQQAVTMALPDPPVPVTNALAPEFASAPNSVPLPPRLHEIEVWSGSKKDVFSIPAQ